MSNIHELQSESSLSAVILNVYDDPDLSLSLVQEMGIYFDFNVIGALTLAFSQYIKQDILDYIKKQPWDYKEVSEDVFLRIIELRSEDLKANTDKAFLEYWNCLTEDLKEEYFLLVSELCGSNCDIYIKHLLKVHPSISHQYIQSMNIPGTHPEFNSLDTLFDYLRIMGHHESILNFFVSPKKEWHKTSIDILYSIKQGPEYFKAEFPEHTKESLMELAIERSPENRTVQKLACDLLSKDDYYFRNIFLKSPLLTYQGFCLIISHFNQDDISDLDLNYPRWSQQDFQKAIEAKYQNPLITETLRYSLNSTSFHYLKNNFIIYKILNHPESRPCYSSFDLDSGFLGRLLILLKKSRKPSMSYSELEFRMKLCSLYNPTLSSLKISLYQEIKLLILKHKEKYAHNESIVSNLENKKREIRAQLLKDPKTKIMGIF